MDNSPQAHGISSGRDARAPGRSFRKSDELSVLGDVAPPAARTAERDKRIGMMATGLRMPVGKSQP